MRRAEAEALALTALGWIAERDDALCALLAASGLSADDLRARAGDPELLGFVLDHLLQDDAMVLAFAAKAGVAPEAALRARAALPGGEAHHWT